MQAVVTAENFQALLNTVRDKGYDILGPVIRDNSIINDRISSVEDLPAGWIEEKDGGKYRLKKTDSDMFFAHTVGPQSWKKFLYPSERVLVEFEKTGHGFRPIKSNGEIPKLAFLGVRSCDLAAIGILDKILTKGPYEDMAYRRYRDNNLIIAVNCVRAGDTCFCHSMNTGPRAASGFDLALTEIIEDGRHYFVTESGSPEGEEILKAVPHDEAGESELSAAEKAIGNAAENMGRKLETADLKDLLYRNFDHQYWEEIAERCLTCGNCTMVCPTCFCSNVEDRTDLSGSRATRIRRLDSCYTVDFSYIHGGSIRASDTSRYRQWLMHKLAYWVDQFGMFGCVGCGRCITWCPVGIDLTVEAPILTRL